MQQQDRSLLSFPESSSGQAGGTHFDNTRNPLFVTKPGRYPYREVQHLSNGQMAGSR